MRTALIFALCITVSSNLLAQQVEKLIVQGNKFYRQQQYDQAEKQYRKVVTADPKNGKALFNLGNALYKLNKADEAKSIFNDIAKNDNEPANRSAAYYNYGVILTNEKKLEESIEAYKNALRQNPDDTEARENLQKALLEQKKKNPPKKKEDQKKQNQDKQQKPQSKMSKKEAEQKLKLLEQKEKEAQQRLQKEKAKTGASLPKDW
ncbi:MAG TPA: tetratricopeptide repeat protein [Chitinophagaceae bacterium]|jgi:Putative Zn-dependent protease, contains TPR repeats